MKKAILSIAAMLTLATGAYADEVCDYLKENGSLKEKNLKYTTTLAYMTDSIIKKQRYLEKFTQFYDNSEFKKLNSTEENYDLMKYILKFVNHYTNILNLSEENDSLVIPSATVIKENYGNSEMKGLKILRENGIKVDTDIMQLSKNVNDLMIYAKKNNRVDDLVNALYAINNKAFFAVDDDDFKIIQKSVRFRFIMIFITATIYNYDEFSGDKDFNVYSNKDNIKRMKYFFEKDYKKMLDIGSDIKSSFTKTIKLTEKYFGVKHSKFIITQINEIDILKGSDDFSILKKIVEMKDKEFEEILDKSKKCYEPFKKPFFETVQNFVSASDS